jgi:hypothetical protein
LFLIVIESHHANLVCRKMVEMLESDRGNHTEYFLYHNHLEILPRSSTNCTREIEVKNGWSCRFNPVMPVRFFICSL